MSLLKRALRLCVPDPANGDGKNKKHLTTLSLAALIFFSVSGGPYGTEDAVAAVGAKYTLIGYLILPLFWCLPEALITVEYAGAFPEAAGSAAWVAAAFTPFWGWMEAWLAFISGMLGLAAYPVLMVSYMELVWPALASGYPKVLMLLAITTVIFTIKYIGLEVVGVGETINCVFVLAPFVVLLFFAIPDWDANKWGQETKEKDWEKYINVMFWNLNYWSLSANLTGEVENPARALPRAMSIAVGLVMFSYLIPLGTCLAVLKVDGQEWDVGFLGEAARLVGGKWLMRWVVVAAIASSLGLMLAQLASASYQAHGLGQRGYVPSLFAHRSPHFDTPTWGIWIQFIPTCLLVNRPFEAILSMINTTFAASLLLGFAAAIWLRVKMPELERPYRVPVNTWGMFALLFIPAGLLAWIVAIPFYKVQQDILICLLGSIAAGVVGWYLMNAPAVHNQRWVPFFPIQHDWSRPIHEQGVELKGKEVVVSKA